MKRTIAKLETKIQSLQRKVKKYEDHEDKFEDMQERLFHRKPKKDCNLFHLLNTYVLYRHVYIKNIVQIIFRYKYYHYSLLTGLVIDTTICPINPSSIA